MTCSGTLAVHKVMNALQYDGAGMGNHEFNYGLDFLSQITNTDFGVPGVQKAATAARRISAGVIQRGRSRIRQADF